MDTSGGCKKMRKLIYNILRGSKLAVLDGPRRMQNFTVAGAEGQRLRMNEKKK